MRNQTKKTNIFISEFFKSSIKTINKPIENGFFAYFSVIIFQYHSAKYRRERECDKPRKYNRTRHCNRKLSIKYAHRSTHKGNRHKNRSHKQGNGNNCPTDFFKHPLNGYKRRYIVFFHFGVNRLHDHNGIIYHNPNGKHQRKKRNHIDG